MRQVGISELGAFFHFKLAPLRIRRDMAMLGLIHRSVLCCGTPVFERFSRLAAYPGRNSRRWHSKRLHDPREAHHTDILARSALGLIRVYNPLPEYVVQKTSVKEFQHSLQGIAMQRAQAQGARQWI